MKDLYKFVFVLVLFVLTLLVLDRGIGLGYSYLYNSQTNKLTYAWKNCDDQIVILGSSRANHHYIPSVISDSTRMTCFNFGAGGQNIYYHYAILNMILEHNSPQKIIYELLDIDFKKTGEGHDKAKLSVLNPVYTINDSVKNIVRLQGVSESVCLDLFWTYRYNSTIFDVLHDKYFLNIQMKDNGYVPISGEWNYPIEYVKDKEEFDLQKIGYINRLIKLCNDYNIKLIIAVSPYFQHYEYTNPYEKVIPLLKGDFEFWNYGNDSIFLNDNKLFKDVLHLNAIGAERYSKIIAHRLKLK